MLQHVAGHHHVELARQVGGQTRVEVGGVEGVQPERDPFVLDEVDARDVVALASGELREAAVGAADVDGETVAARASSESTGESR